VYCVEFRTLISLWLSCVLNQTDIGNNNNKFYNIQLIEADAGGNKFWVFTKWGRVGYLPSCLSPYPILNIFFD